jgi:hypothetical protein
MLNGMPLKMMDLVLIMSKRLLKSNKELHPRNPLPRSKNKNKR